MEWSWGRSLGPFEGRVWVFGSGGRRAGREVVAVPGRGSLEEEVEEGVTSDWLNVKTGL